MKWNLVKGFQPVSLCDWPSLVSSVIFLGGCNFRCPTCHNKEIAFHPEKCPTIPVEDIFLYLEKKKSWIDGVVISGGEPTLFAHLYQLIYEIRKLGFKVKLDTNGSNPKIIKKLLEDKMVDLFAVDVKGPYEKYPILTGGRITEEQARKNLSEIFQMAKFYPPKFIFRMTMVPFLTQEDIHITKTYLPEGFDLKLQEYKDVMNTVPATINLEG